MITLANNTGRAAASGGPGRCQDRVAGMVPGGGAGFDYFFYIVWFIFICDTPTKTLLTLFRITWPQYINNI